MLPLCGQKYFLAVVIHLVEPKSFSTFAFTAASILISGG
jgi:hypothetical protein